MTGPGLKERALLSLMNFVVRIGNRKVDIAKFQRDNNKFAAKVIRVDIVDMASYWNVCVKDGRLRFVADEIPAVGGIRVWRADDFIAMARGKRRMMDPATGEEYEEEYTPVTAYQYGDIEIWGNAANADALLFVYGVWDKIRSEGDMADVAAQEEPVPEEIPIDEPGYSDAGEPV